MDSKEEIRAGKPHRKICKCGCKMEFYGRRNQKYVNRIHKAKVNNFKRHLRTRKLSPLFKDIKTAYGILRSTPKEKLGEKIPLSKLTSQGFNVNIPTIRIKNTQDGREFLKLVDYAFCVIDGKYIIINKLN